jgi:hypothetical protein
MHEQKHKPISLTKIDGVGDIAKKSTTIVAPKKSSKPSPIF